MTETGNIEESFADAEHINYEAYWICPCGKKVEDHQYRHATVDYPCRNVKCDKHLSDYNLKKV